MNKNEYQKIVDCFDKLQQTLLNLSQLPLSIVGVKCISAYYRKTKSLPVGGITIFYSDRDHVVENVAQLKSSGNFPSFLPSIKVLITLERSNKWGNDLTVIRNLKSAFYIDLSRRLKILKKWFSVPLKDQLYVILNNIVFNIKIVHQKEISLLIQINSNVLKKDSIKDKTNSAEQLRKKLIHIPLISQQLFSLSERYLAFGETCQYVKQWLSYNFLSKAFEGMAIELLVAHLFVNQQSIPLNGLAGFAQFLQFLSTYNFVLNPVVVDLKNSFNLQTISEAKENFVKKRITLPPLVIITPEDILGISFTILKPEPIIFCRAIKLAEAAYQNLYSSVLNNSANLEFQLPIHDTCIYDIIIHLNIHYITIVDKKKSGTLIKPEKQYLPIVDFDPVKNYVKNLKNNFNFAALFFYNCYKTLIIGVLLRPNYLTERDAKVITNCQIRFKKNEILIPNIRALIEDFKILGGKLVRHITYSDKIKNLIKIENIN